MPNDKKPKVSSVTNEPKKNLKKPFAKVFKKPGLTEQIHRDDCNINSVVSRYRKTGILINAREKLGEYKTAPNFTFHEAMNFVSKTNEMFEMIPADIRNRFQNDPQAFSEFAENPENQDELIKMGLIEPHERAVAQPQGEQVAEARSASEEKPPETTGE